MDYYSFLTLSPLAQLAYGFLIGSLHKVHLLFVVFCSLFYAFYYHLHFCLFLRQRRLAFSIYFSNSSFQGLFLFGQALQNTFLIRNTSLLKRKLILATHSSILTQMSPLLVSLLLSSQAIYISFHCVPIAYSTYYTIIIFFRFCLSHLTCEHCQGGKKSYFL